MTFNQAARRIVYGPPEPQLCAICDAPTGRSDDGKLTLRMPNGRSITVCEECFDEGYSDE
jgi:hypothetical protein